MKRGFTQTRREQKHQMLLTFMASSQRPKQQPKPAPAKIRFLKTLLSLFM